MRLYKFSSRCPCHHLFYRGVVPEISEKEQKKAHLLHSIGNIMSGLRSYLSFALHRASFTAFCRLMRRKHRSLYNARRMLLSDNRVFKRYLTLAPPTSITMQTIKFLSLTALCNFPLIVYTLAKGGAFADESCYRQSYSFSDQVLIAVCPQSRIGWADRARSIANSRP